MRSLSAFIRNNTNLVSTFLLFFLSFLQSVWSVVLGHLRRALERRERTVHSVRSLTKKGGTRAEMRTAGRDLWRSSALLS